MADLSAEYATSHVEDPLGPYRWSSTYREGCRRWPKPIQAWSGSCLRSWRVILQDGEHGTSRKDSGCHRAGRGYFENRNKATAPAKVLKKPARLAACLRGAHTIATRHGGPKEAARGWHSGGGLLRWKQKSERPSDRSIHSSLRRLEILICQTA